MIRSLAVLPLQNLSGDPSQEYFADGMTEELIGRLSKIHGIRVISRTSAMHFKNTKLSMPEIAKTLGVGRVLALTATATPTVAKSIAAAFEVAPDDVIQTGFHRPNLSLHIHPSRGGADGRVVDPDKLAAPTIGARIVNQPRLDSPAPCADRLPMPRTSGEMPFVGAGSAMSGFDCFSAAIGEKSTTRGAPLPL